jgi:hypothetical protein
MEFTLQELNEIYYCLGKVLTLNDISLVNTNLVEQIRDKVRNEIERQAMDSDEDYKASLIQDEQRYKNNKI